MTGRRAPLPERLMRRVVKDPLTGCWLWTGSVQAPGYGRIGVGIGSDRRTDYTHRVSWELHRGPIPDGMTIDHLCLVKACCNPDHLEVVTQGVNATRANIRQPRVAACKRAGHPYTGDNARVWADGYPRCRACRLVREAAA